MPKFIPIGYVKSKLTPHNRDYGGTSQIVIDYEYEDALDGIEDFSHLYVIYHLHLLKEDHGNRIHPKNRQDLPLVGIFATHTQFRPNRIALTIVELQERKKNVLVVNGLDAFNGTPVLDIKPFIAPRIEGLRYPEWILRLEEKI